MNRSPWRLEEVDGIPWRLEEVDGGDEQYPVESRFTVRHTPPDEQDLRFDRSAPTQVRFVRFAVRHTPPDPQDPVLTVRGPFPLFCDTPDPFNEQDPVSNMAGRTQGCFLCSTVRQASFPLPVPSKPSR